MMTYTHQRIAWGKALAEAISMGVPFSDVISHRSFFWYPNRKV